MDGKAMMMLPLLSYDIQALKGEIDFTAL